MTLFFVSKALLPNGWRNDVLIKVDSAGYITDIAHEKPHEHAIVLTGPALPGMLNVHSHAFQYAMGGMTEYALGEKDTFWTWRKVMYRFLETLDPDSLHAIAATAYMEMLKGGFTSVGEFHYIHHQPDGKPYSDRSFTSEQIIRAAKYAGIGITHLPVLYSYSGFGAQKPEEGQKRFINNDTQIMDIISSLSSKYPNDPQVTIGLALHSLRAVSPEMLQSTTTAMQNLHPKAPIHIHIAEQIKEVKDCIKWSHQRPVEWLLNNTDINEAWCLVHATHMNEDETQRLAKSRATAGICPTTEANLGDGLFNLPDYIREQGSFGVGTDSNISVSMIEELRTLEYGQRLLRQERAVAKTKAQSSVGSFLFTTALTGGAKALGRPVGGLEVGKRADFIILDLETPSLIGKSTDFILDAMVFAGNNNPIRHVIVGGKFVVKDFKHRAEDEILRGYKKTLIKLQP